MKKFVLAAVAGLAATTLTAASVVPAAGDTKVHTKRFVSHFLDGRSVSPNSFVSAGVDRHAGHVIGYDSSRSRTYPHPDRIFADTWYSFALKNGTIAVVIHDKSTVVDSGEIVHGTGKYKGIRGTLTARPAAGPSLHLTLTYHF
jgi:hypothetical protein